MKERFEGNQTAAARALGVSQPYLNQLVTSSMKGEGRGPGLGILLLMREKTGRSIEELLGLPPPPADELLERLRMTADLEIARIRAEAKRVGFVKTPEPEEVPRPVLKKHAPKKAAG